MKEEKLNAKALGRALPISTKQSIEIANFVRGKKLKNALSALQQVAGKKQAIPYTRFQKGGTGHRKKMGPGRYPVKACSAFISLLQNAEANAQNKGMDVSSLFIKKIVANKAAKAQHFGRRRTKMKRTHLEIVLQEAEQTAKPKDAKKETKKENKND